jgi:SET and MYND domain-containing protein
MWEVRMLPTPVRGVMQLLLRAGMNVNGFYQGNGKDREWKKLESHEERFKGDKERWEDIVLQARGAMGFSGLGESEERLGDAVGLLCRVRSPFPSSISSKLPFATLTSSLNFPLSPGNSSADALKMKTNSFRATSPDGTPIGLLLDPVFALANHSCTPNAELQCDGRHIQLRALREIKEGEQIFISYIDESEYLEARRQILEERYFFKCDCERCVEEAGRNGGDPP